MSPKDAPLPQPAVAPAPPPLLGQNPNQTKPKAKSMQPSFLGTGSTPDASQTGTKTLLGQ